MKPIEIFEKKPSDFAPKFHVVACYILFNGKLLVLQRAAHDGEPDTWTVPAGGLEEGETPLQGAQRELLEETGLSLAQLHEVGVLYIRKPDHEYIYHLFHSSLDHEPSIELSQEHQAFLWATPKELESLPLMVGALETFRYFLKKRA